MTEEATTNSESVPDLSSVLEECWVRFEHGASDTGAAYHLPAIATIEEDAPALRVVVLRAAHATHRTLVCHTDRRSAKFAQLNAKDDMAWLFYDPQDKVQIRAVGHATIHLDDAEADARWALSTTLARRCYLGQPPGAEAAEATSGLPAEFQHRPPSVAESEAGRGNFAAISCTIARIDWLHLHIHGHRRAQFEFEDGNWRSRWVMP